jgi:hypothetical protein
VRDPRCSWRWFVVSLRAAFRFLLLWLLGVAGLPLALAWVLSRRLLGRTFRLVAFLRASRLSALYLCLAVLLAGTAGLWVSRRSDHWADQWLPNFVAEWSGIFIAVAVVDRLTYRARSAEREVALAPARLYAAGVVREILQQILEVPTRPVEDLRQPQRVTVQLAYEWIRTLVRVEARLRRCRAEFAPALESNILRTLDQLLNSQRDARRAFEELGEPAVVELLEDAQRQASDQKLLREPRWVSICDRIAHFVRATHALDSAAVDVCDAIQGKADGTARLDASLFE